MNKNNLSDNLQSINQSSHNDSSHNQSMNIGSNTGSNIGLNTGRIDKQLMNEQLLNNNAEAAIEASALKHTPEEIAVELSHANTRVFQAHKLKPPRDFSSDKWRWVALTDVPVVLEIGAGKGKHAIAYAQSQPEHKIIAIERTLNKFQAFAKSAEQLTTSDNLYPVHADAIAWSVFALPPKSIAAVFILYPNPEPSNPNQQWLNMPFFEFLLSRLVEGGKITLASNIISYIDTAETQARELWRLPLLREPVPTTSQRTHFEVKYLARGERCEQLLMTKPAGYVTRFDEFDTVAQI